MGRRKVLAPDGAEWEVGRDWVPVRVRLRREREPGSAFDLMDFADLDLGPLTILLGALFLVVFLFLVVWPLVALALEVVILILVFLGALFARVVLRRPT